jgi:prepilin signal peptidase PulO-like enzyme (type II secretory pathway)
LVWGLSWLVLREEGIGGGDLTLVAMLGAWLGLSGMVLALALGVLFGAVMGMALVFAGYVKERFWQPVGLAVASTLVFWAVVEWLFASALPGGAQPHLHAAFALFSMLVGASLGYFYTRSTRDRDAEKPRIAFGPALVLGGLVSLFWGDRLVTWYMTQMGPI